MNPINIIQHGHTHHGDVTLGPSATWRQENVVHVHQTPADTCLADLKVTNPRHDKDRIIESIESIDSHLLRETYSWIFEHAAYRQWRHNPENQMLWLRGDPGKGKTMLLCGLVEELELKASDGGTLLLSYFFCQNSDVRLNTATNVVRGLIYMLATDYEQLSHYVKTPYSKDGKELFEGENNWEALRDIFLNMVNDTHFPEVILVLDALDECAVNPRSLIKLIARTASSPRIKWLVSSRNLPEIEGQFKRFPRIVTLSLEDDSDLVSGAVQKYIRARVDWLSKSKDYDDELRSGVEDRLLSRAEGTYLWVALVCKELDQDHVTIRSTLATLDSFPKGLEPLYDRMLKKIDETDDKQLCKQILAIATVAFRPLTLEEFRPFLEDPVLFNLPSVAYDDIKKIKYILVRCGSFVTLRKGILSLVHQSAKDFLLENGSDTVFLLGQEAQHHAMHSRSLEMLSQSLRRNVYDLETSATRIDEIRRPDVDPLAALQYVCIYWVDHWCEGHNSSQVSLDGEGSVATFIEANFTHWLEALSLLGGLRSIISSFLRLKSLVEMQAESKASRLLSDASRFLQSHVDIIERHPLQVYISALIFTPYQSSILHRFRHQRPNCIEVRGYDEEQWGKCLQTLENNAQSVLCVAIDAGGRYIASGSEDKTVKIWDAATGLCLHILADHNGVISSVVFVPETDGMTVLSASADNTIKVWDAQKEKCVRTLGGHMDMVRSVTCALNSSGVTIGSASYDRTIKIWDLKTGICLQTLTGHTDIVVSVAFIPESGGSEIISASWDKTVKIWDTISGYCLRTLTGHTDCVNSVAFICKSGVDKIASASDDKSIRVWDKATGKCLRVLTGHNDSVMSVSFRPDGRDLVSASVDMTVKIWDIELNQCLQTLTGHTERISSVQFSPDGRRVISAAEDFTIKIWDAETGQYSEPRGDHPSRVSAIALSPDGRKVVSSSHYGQVNIWDACTGRCLKTTNSTHEDDFPMAKDTLATIAYSPDGRHFVSSAIDKTIKIWDAATGQHLQTIAQETSSPKFYDIGAHPTPVELVHKVFGRTGEIDSAHVPLTSRLSLAAMPYEYLKNTDNEKSDKRWVTWDGEKLLHLSHDFQPSCFDIYGSQMAIGCRSGAVIILEVFEERLHQLGF